MTVGAFVRSAPPVSKNYLADLLPPPILAIPGVVKTIDVAMIEKLVLDGKLHPDVAKAARCDTEGTPRVSGPGAIVVKL
ncbi:MAG: hypothetical protein ACOYOB_21010 [Myxococcota bacterium]